MDGSDEYVSGTIFEHCILEYSTGGIKFEESSKAFIDNCTLSNNSTGVSYNSMASSMIRNSTFHSNGSGINSYSITGSYSARSMSGSKIKNNEFYSNTGSAIVGGGYMVNASSNLYLGNTVRGQWRLGNVVRVRGRSKRVPG